MSRAVFHYNEPRLRFDLAPGHCSVYLDGDGWWKLHACVATPKDPSGEYFEIGLNVDGDFIRDGVAPKQHAWGFKKHAPGEWHPDPSIVAEIYEFHEFVTVVGVPDPAPWETP